MDEKWKEYEHAVFDECQEWATNSYTQWTVKRDEKMRGMFSCQVCQIDVLLTSSGDNPTRIVVEAKHYSTKVTVKTVDSFIGFLEDVGIEDGLIVCEEGYSAAAINRAHEGTHAITVDILSLKEIREEQGKCGLLRISKSMFFFMAPFGWLADFPPLSYYDDPALLLYPRGLTDVEAMFVEEEYMILRLKEREDDSTLSYLLKEDKLKITAVDKEADVYYVEYSPEKNLSYRVVTSQTWEEWVLTVYREFRSFIAVVYVVCPDIYKKRDRRKALSFMEEAFEHNGNNK